MDVLFFLRERTRFIRKFHEAAGSPFRETIRKIEGGETPFIPEYSEDREPPFLAEWSEAETGLEIVGQTCVSMLSESLRLYFKTWESLFGISWEKGEQEKYFRGGFVRGYQRCFGELLGLVWSECPADFDLLEQITLARNATQHPTSITAIRAEHDRKTRERFPSPFFAHDSELHLASGDDSLGEWFAPSIHVSWDKLLAAIEQVEALADWLEGRMFAARYGGAT
jgi:hypothetical protein